MTFSRSHAGMLAVVSFFTGMIAPVVGNGSIGLPFPLTSLQIPSYITFLLLILTFFIVSTKKWKMFSLVGSLLIALLIYFLLMIFKGEVMNRSGEILSKFSWGWVFLLIGGILLIFTLFWKEKEEKINETSLLFDSILGIIGSFALLSLSVLIVFVSLSGVNKGAKHSLIQENFGTGFIDNTFSGVILSRPFKNISHLQFERAYDSISFIGEEQDGTITNYNDKKGTTPKKIAEREKSVVSGELVILNTQFGQKIYKTSGKIITPIITADDTSTIAWGETSPTGEYIIRKNGEKLGDSLADIQNITLSRSGYDVMVLGKTGSGENIITKNGEYFGLLGESYKKGSYQSNGSHAVLVEKNGENEKVIYDGVTLDKEYAEVREAFLDKSGNSYAFFARPIGEKTYCLFTRYRGNICGFTGYMNPRLGADGTSILYAGQKDGIWKIYRNTTSIVENPGYTKTDIGNDYFFLDITNPKQYLFVEKQESGKYTLRKNGKLIPGLWDDIGLDVTFGYDNTIIMTLKDEKGWRIAEL